MNAGRRVWVLVGLLAVGTSACGSNATAVPPTPATAAPPSASPATTAAPTTTLPAPPTTVAYQPAAPQATASAAAGALLQAWGRGDRSAAASVAAPAAVAALFVDPGRTLQARGCSDGAAPITCSYADRSSANGHFYEIDAVQTPTGGWYVGSVEITD